MRRLKDSAAFERLSASLAFMSGPAIVWIIWFAVMALAPCSCVRAGCSVQQMPVRCAQ